MADCNLKEQFRRFLVDNTERVRTVTGFYDSAFMRMVEKHGPILAAKIRIDRAATPEGFVKLWEFEHLELSVEAIVVERREFHPLLDGRTRERAAKRLRSYGYEPNGVLPDIRMDVT